MGLGFLFVLDEASAGGHEGERAVKSAADAPAAAIEAAPSTQPGQPLISQLVLDSVALLGFCCTVCAVQRGLRTSNFTCDAGMCHLLLLLLHHQ